MRAFTTSCIKKALKETEEHAYETVNTKLTIQSTNSLHVSAKLNTKNRNNWNHYLKQIHQNN